MRDGLDTSNRKENRAMTLLSSKVSFLLRQAGLVALVLSVLAIPAQADLLDYEKKPEPKYAWKLKEKITTEEGTIYDLHLVSQVWHDILWEHQLQIYQARGIKPNGTMLLWNTGGAASPGNMAFALALAKKIEAPVAFLYHVPNQPLL